MSNPKEKKCERCGKDKEHHDHVLYCKPSPSQSCEHDKGENWESGAYGAPKGAEPLCPFCKPTPSCEHDAGKRWERIEPNCRYAWNKDEYQTCPICKPTAVEPLGNPDIGYGGVTLCSNPHKAVEPSDKIIGAKITPYPFKDNGSNKTHIDLSDVGKQACKPVEPKTPQQLASDSAKIAIDEFDKNNSVAGRKFYGTVEPSWESIDRKEAEKIDRAILDAIPVEPSVESIAEEIVNRFKADGRIYDEGFGEIIDAIADALRNERNRHG